MTELKNQCENCFSTKTLLECELCHHTTCKKCAHFVSADDFKYLIQKPDFLKHQTFCHQCFESQISVLKNEYDHNLELARDIAIFEANQGKETRLIKRKEKPIKVTDALDKEDAFMFLAYQAVCMGYNAVIDVDINYKKVKINNYQTHLYSGSGIPAHVSDKKLLRDRSLWSNPN